LKKEVMSKGKKEVKILISFTLRFQRVTPDYLRGGSLWKKENILGA